MRVTLHQPEHLPWLGFFHKMAQADLYVVMDNVQYRHRYFQNRNQIQGTSGPLWVNVPVLKTQHRYGPIKDVLIDNSRDWRKPYWGSIEHHYRKHPYFDRYADPLQAILMTPTTRLIDLNMALIHFFRRALAIDTPLVLASDLAVEGQRTALIHQICLKVGASTYLSGPFGRDYLDESLLRASDLTVEYHDFPHPSYPQRQRVAFTTCLSTLDLLMNCGPDSRSVLLQNTAAPIRPLTLAQALLPQPAAASFA